MVTFKEFFSFKNNRFFWINLIGMIVAVVAISWGTLMWLDGYTRHGEAVVVPPVKGMQLTEGESMLHNRNLKAVVVDSSYVKGKAPGEILEQNPVGGAKVKEGRTVYLTINTDRTPLVNVPDIMDNSSLRQAEAKLRALGFKVTEPVYISGEKDWVYSVKYKGRELRAGEKVPREATLTLCVGNGSEAIEEDSTVIGDTPATEGEEKAVVDDSWF